VRHHGLGVFKRAAGLEMGGDAGPAEHVAAELGLGRAPANHAIGIDAVHRLVGERAGLADRGA
jgi:hypothetical protein